MQTAEIQKLQDWLRDNAGDWKTEPMSLSGLADYFCVDRQKMPSILKAIDGVQVCGKGRGRRYRVPVGAMPPKYLLELALQVGLLEPVRLSKIAGL